MTYHTLMTSTLPTVIGMGVVSRSTETMFGKGRGRGRRVTGRATSRGRKFSGKVYREANWHTTKKSADRDAEYFRKAGHLARVVKYYNARTKRWGYMVYVR